MQSVHLRTLRRARDIVGSDAALAERLQVAEREVKYWIDGSLPVPPQMFFIAVEIIMENDQKNENLLKAYRPRAAPK
jgi:DNA-binding transcriptional regulator YdaS (Cro superfamily)